MQGVSKLRNRVIGRVFHELHPIEQWGSGTGRNRDAFSRDHFQRAGEATPYGRDGPAHPRFV
jgi:predicted HTH transcriptional regulator